MIRHTHLHYQCYLMLILYETTRALDIDVRVEYLLQEKIQYWVIMKVLFRAEREMQQERDLRNSVQQGLFYGQLGRKRTLRICFFAS